MIEIIKLQKNNNSHKNKSKIMIFIWNGFLHDVFRTISVTANNPFN